MKKLVGLFTVAILLILCSCSTNKTNGVIDCYSIKVTSGGKSINQTYNASTARVYEYKSANGDSIYTSAELYSYDYQSDSTTYKLKVYADRYTSDYIEYTYSKFIGWLTVENNYYLDLDNRTIDSEVKYSEYLYAKNPDNSAADNKKAYECAKNNYYIISGSTYVLRLDLEEKGLERHTYTKLGDDAIIEYRAKWF